MNDVIRAWKDPSYRAGLSAEELAALPANPAGEAMSSDELRGVLGGGREVAASGGYVCTLTTECPWFSFCCREE